jgi:sulfur carrier protein ThiS
MAYERLLRQEALLGRTLVVSKNGKPVQVSAKKLLKQFETRQDK